MIPKVKEFFDFINERHNIYTKRFLLKQPAPWTEDPVLQKYKFCNVYRELDKGSIWYMKNIAAQIKEPKQLIAATIIYRLVNTIKIFELCGIPKGLGSFVVFSEKLKELKKSGQLKFNPAYRIFGTFGRGGSEKDAVSELFVSMESVLENIASIAEDLEKCSSLERAHEILQRVYRVGPFVAYEIVCDLMYSGFLKFNEDDFVYVGPGALGGLKIIFGEQLPYSPEELVRILADSQYAYTNFQIIKSSLSLRSIEHSSCEFRKYWNLKNKKGKGRLFTSTKLYENRLQKMVWQYRINGAGEI